ncbi:nucleotidyl transferase AbiEii/AbiGii toxin family protein [Acidithiobacillus ferrooxidans]|jgi:hypothetical protein|nr:nucleotidyl transferase AbiEii/AbiGii toxin family protein [Acidithiobacillus ferrooxidans]
MVTGDDLEAWLRGTAEVDTMGLQAFLYESAIDSLPPHLPKLEWTIGGGTVLMFQYRHRLSRDIDIFITDAQYLYAANVGMHGTKMAQPPLRTMPQRA